MECAHRLATIMRHSVRAMNERETGLCVSGENYNELLEAAIGIEPMNKGFADLCLTTWLRRRIWKNKG